MKGVFTTQLKIAYLQNYKQTGTNFNSSHQNKNGYT